MEKARGSAPGLDLPGDAANDPRVRPHPSTLGIDLGTSGVRAVVRAPDGATIGRAAAIERPRRSDPGALWSAVAQVLDGLDLARVGAVAVAGTSGTIVGVRADGTAVGGLSLYDETATAAALRAVRAAAAPDNAARAETSPLGRALELQDRPGVERILHEADWIGGRLCGLFDVADANNALKTGYDPVARRWPGWIARTGLRPGVLPRVVEPGTPLRPVTPALAARFGFAAGALVAAGTTDGCASFLATGAARAGDAVTALGSTLTLKLLSQAPVSLPGQGIYSHALFGQWLAGGASNSGGAVLARFFTPAELDRLSARIDPARPGGLGYYPLLRPGERFPVCDPDLPPRMTPRPADDAVFLHALLEGMAEIEACGYRVLASAGGTPVRRVLTVGGGAANQAWTAIRRRVLGVEVHAATAASAAGGAALLAGRGHAPP